jgi:hypothetical protein
LTYRENVGKVIDSSYSSVKTTGEFCDCCDLDLDTKVKDENLQNSAVREDIDTVIDMFERSHRGTFDNGENVEFQVLFEL